MIQNWSDFEHSLWRTLKECGLENQQHFLLAVSGGLDSMVLLESFLNVKPQAYFKIVHFHHGDSADKKLTDYRNAAFETVKKYVSQKKLDNLKFISSNSDIQLKSEDEMRTARWNFINSQKTDLDVVVTGHHLDDHLETILLKMIRGTSTEGFVAFQMWNGLVFRPFVEIPKTDLLNYAQSRNLIWEEDYTNQDSHYLRNWVRGTWLKDLDDKFEGGRKNLARSLFRILSDLGRNPEFCLIYSPSDQQDSLSRVWYLTLGKSDQLRGLALFLKKHQIHHFTTGQLEEIRKRLDKNQKDYTFEILGRKWVINATQIMLQ